MGVSIMMQVDGNDRWEDITPGWRSAMASMLREISGNANYLCFGPEDIEALEDRKVQQRTGEVDPPFDRSDEWVQCFDKIIARIKTHGTAVVDLVW